jgi:hypothetical protein
LQQTLTRRQWALLIVAGAASLLICLVPIQEYGGKRPISVLVMSGAFSLVKFSFLAAVALEIVVLCGATPGGRRQLIPLLGLLTLGELAGQTKLYSHVGTHPFVTAADLYPHAPALTETETGPPRIDAKNYRLNKPMQVLQWHDPEVLGNIVLEVPSNINIVYETATYAGVDSDVKKNLIQLLEAFDGHPERWRCRQGVSGTLTNPRLLDILGVKYDWEGHNLVVRPNALARLSLFHHYDVLADRTEMLTRLNQQSFDPTQTIVLSESPPQVAGESRRFQQVDFQSHGSSRLSTQVHLTEPAVLLFNDSFSPYWTCTCNGQTLPVMMANGNFMAAALPAGTCDVKWEFRPTPVLRLFWLSVGATVVLASVAVSSLFHRKRQASQAVVPMRLAA